ncbi:uncharacterized protein LOC135468892 isoform X2 [Liolophura sinensis]|uniref:uncharacterized protein LOC135468892 isoform X2 n=1 Tax=Liolophura sinensis TaxID=3198878 RepID=UPI003158F9BC
MVSTMPKVPRTRKPVKAVAEVVTTKAVRDKKNTPEKQILENLRKRYGDNRNAKNAVQIKQYMRGQFAYFGLKAPERRALDKEVLAESPQLNVYEVRHLLHLLWQESEREFQMFGIDYGAKHLKTLIGPDVKTSKESLDCVHSLIVTQSWWDTVDMLASKLVGGLVAAHPKALVPVMDEWITDENMWTRRSAILHQLSYNENTDKDRLFRYCLLCCHEKEFFIQKAIGWALRNFFRYNPAAVKTFVNANKEKLAPLSVKEALKHA